MNLLSFEDSCKEIASSEAIVDFATAGWHHGLSTIYNEQNVFHWKKQLPDFELQKTRAVFFKSPCDGILISRQSAQLGFGSELVDS